VQRVGAIILRFEIFELSIARMRSKVVEVTGRDASCDVLCDVVAGLLAHFDRCRKGRLADVIIVSPCRRNLKYV
jgi:hypothetical protein